MAKVAAKTSAKAAKKSTPEAASAVSGSQKIEKACENALNKLKELGIDEQLQSDLQWCLGSFRSDNNPVGLYAMADRALTILREEKAKKTKGVTAKMITDLEKAIQDR